jgi:hypothetical protein
MSLLANLSRVHASEEILPIVDDGNGKDPATPVMLMVSADLHWRRKEWQAAIEVASRALDTEPNDFHALSIIVTSYGHLKALESAYPYAKRLVVARPPSWTFIKVLFTSITFFKLLTAKGRASRRSWMLRCDQEAQADRDALAWARELIASQEAGSEPIAV